MDIYARATGIDSPHPDHASALIGRYQLSDEKGPIALCSLPEIAIEIGEALARARGSKFTAGPGVR